MTWLVGNRLITVTTSGCSQKPLKHGLCDKCFTMCKLETSKSPENEPKHPSSSRSGSNEKDDLSGSNRASRQNSDDKSNNNTSTSSPAEDGKKVGDKLEQLPSKLQQLVKAESNKPEKLGCACWCQGWAEVYVRRPTGDMSWVMRVQNQISQQSSMYDFPLNEISTLFMPSLYQSTYEYDSYDIPDQAEENVVPQEEEFGAKSVPISIPGKIFFICQKYVYMFKFVNLK